MIPKNVKIILGIDVFLGTLTTLDYLNDSQFLRVKILVAVGLVIWAISEGHL